MLCHSGSCHLQKRTTILTAARPEPSALSGQRAVVAWIVEWVRHGCMHWATENRLHLIRTRQKGHVTSVGVAH